MKFLPRSIPHDTVTALQEQGLAAFWAQLYAARGIGSAARYRAKARPNSMRVISPASPTDSSETASIARNAWNSRGRFTQRTSSL